MTESFWFASFFTEIQCSKWVNAILSDASIRIKTDTDVAILKC